MSTVDIKNALRQKDIKESFSFMREGAGGVYDYGVGVPDASHDVSIKLEQVNKLVPTQEKYTDKELVGTGGSGITQSANLKSLLNGFPRAWQSNPTMDLWAWYFALGGITTVPGTGNTKKHIVKPIDFSANKPILPSTSMIQSCKPGLIEKFPGIVVSKVEQQFQREGLVKTTVTLRSSGQVETVSVYTFPTIPVLQFYRANHVTIEVGPYGGSYTNMNQILSEVTFTWENQFSDTAAFFPNSGTLNSGESQVKGTELCGDYELKAMIKTYATSDSLNQFWPWVRSNQAIKVRVKGETSGFIEGANKGYTQIEAHCLDPDGDYNSEEIDKFQGQTLNFSMKRQGAMTMLDVCTVEIQNLIAEAGALPV